MNNWSDWKDLHSLSDLGHRARSRCSRESRGMNNNNKILRYGVRRMLSGTSYLQAWCSLPHLRPPRISYQGLKESRVHIYTSCDYSHSLVLAQQKPHPYNKCEVLFIRVCVCVCTSENVWAWAVEGKEWKYLPWGYDKVTRGSQGAPKQRPSCQDRIGLATYSEYSSDLSVLAFQPPFNRVQRSSTSKGHSHYC